MEEQNTSLWFSGKEMLRGKLLKDYVGKNEKTKIVAKIQKVNMDKAGLPQSGKIICKMKFFPGQGKVREFC